MCVCCLNLVFLTAIWFVTCYFTLGVFAPFHFISYVFQVFSTATLFNLISWFVMIWVGTWRHNFIMDYEVMKLDVVHWSLNLVFLTATWFDTFNVSYYSLPPHCISSGWQLFLTATTWYYCVIAIWINTWWYNFIMEYEIMKLYVGH